MKKNLLSLLLVFLLALSLLGCQQDHAQTQPPETETTAPPATTMPAPTAPEAVPAYAEARAQLEAQENVAFEVIVTLETVVENQAFYTESIRNMVYSGMGGDAPAVSMDEKVTFLAPGSTMEENYLSYQEIWAEDVLYTSMEDMCFFSSAMTREEMKGRYTPVILLDESLYGSVTSQLLEKDVLIRFEDAAEPEAWAVPEDAVCLEAEGEAVIDAEGRLQKMIYECTYEWGSGVYTLSVCALVQEDAGQVNLPEEPEAYQNVTYADALRSYIRATGILLQSGSVQVSGIDSIVSQAAGVIRNESIALDYDSREQLLAKVEIDVYFADSTGEEQRYSQEETYIDGKYVVTVNDGVPTTYSDLTDADIEDYCVGFQLSGIADPFYWEEVTVEDLGGVYLVSYTLNENFGADQQNTICELFWGDAAYLNNLATAYQNKELTAYLAFEKYTGIPTAAGWYYEGAHTLDGMEYSLSMQSDYALTVPAFGAYHEITEQWLPEEAPETQATPLFYHVTGENGQQMWLLGTIHVGDSRTGFLPQEIYDAFAASDALALEMDSEAFTEATEKDEKLQEEISNCYYYSNGKTAADYLDAETYQLALKYMKASGNYNRNTPYLKLSMWANAIENFNRQIGHSLVSEQGVEERLTKLAHEQGKEILEVESGLFQTKMLTGWSDDLQVLLLEEALESTAEEYWLDLNALYDLWCLGDEAAMREELSSQVDTSELTEEELAEYEQYKHLLEEYNKAMSYDRNDGMLEVAIEYLESDQVVFYAVGLAHLLDDVNGLVDALREAGYTVELVSYQ